MNLIPDFMEKAKGMTRNPLSIIGLFISTVYAIASAVLGFGIDHLKNEYERLPLIWFVILFPICILVAFVYLVIKHHGKLYAPGDYKDEGNFIRTLDAPNQKLRLQKEVEDIQKDITEDLSGKTLVDTDKFSETNVVRLTDKYLIAEDLALRAFEQGRSVTIKRHSEISRNNKAVAAFDAIAFSGPLVYCIDIRFTIHSHLSKVLREKIKAGFSSYPRAAEDLDFLGDVKFVLIVVSDSPTITTLPNEIEALAQHAKFPVETIVYNFNELRQRFGYS